LYFKFIESIDKYKTLERKELAYIKQFQVEQNMDKFYDIVFDNDFLDFIAKLAFIFNIDNVLIHPDYSSYYHIIYNDFDINKPKKQYSIPHIGSFGFASEHKGFDDIVRLINEQYDEAQINLHITKAHYGDEDGSRQNRVINQIKEISLKPKIKLNITTDFIGNEELLEFTHNNDIIILAYKSGKDPSSLPDYPISTNTPIAITSIGMFSHIYNENLDINLKTIPEILEYNKKTNYVSELRNKWSREILCEEFENLINMI
jgi:hypothetical protein